MLLFGVIINGDIASIIAKLIVISYCTLYTAAQDYFNKDAHYFCQAKCNRQTSHLEENVACHCKDLHPGLKIVMDNLVEFRKLVLHVVNTYRNRLAAGEFKAKNFPQTADMNVINYSVKLEYLAGCALKNPAKFQTICIRTIREYTQSSLYKGPTDAKKTPNMTIPKEAVTLIETMLNSFDKMTDLSLLKRYHWTQPFDYYRMIWSRQQYIGCARAAFPKHKSPSYHAMAACVFEDRVEVGSDIASKGNRIFAEGPPCSQCGYELSCNSKYTNLCGELEPIPTYGYEKPSSTKKPETGNGTVTAATGGAINNVNNGILMFLLVFLLN